MRSDLRGSPFAQARASLQKALELNPGHVDVCKALAMVYHAQGDRRPALEALTKAADLNPIMNHEAVGCRNRYRSFPFSAHATCLFV